MKKFVKKLCVLGMSGMLAVSGVACGGSTAEESVGKLVLPETMEFISATTWGDAMMEAYLRPYWYSREIYNETVVFIGEEGEAKLMFTPSEIDSVRNFNLDKTYIDGKDYLIDGNTIKRVKGSAMPYWDPEEYFLLQPNIAGTSIAADMSKIDFKLDGQRFLRYGEGATFTSEQIAVTYRHNELFDGTVPKAQQDKLGRFLAKIRNNEPVSIMVYGDSVAVGCNASGTIWGGNVNPYMPDAYNIVKAYLEKHYDADIKSENQAVGGWRVSDCIAAYDERIKNKEIDLMILRIGGNDGHSSEKNFADDMNLLLDKFFADYPDANVILQTPDLPNEQSTWTLNIDKMDEWFDRIVENHGNSGQIAIADVQTFYKWLLSKGKRGRDWLANNINHSNDFVIRSYAQIILKTMLGDGYSEEIYE